MHKIRQHSFIPLSLLFVLLLSLSLFAGAFPAVEVAASEDSLAPAGSVIKIYSAKDLQSISENLSGSYKLMNNIVLSGSWTPIGTEADPFTGKFNGNGKTISNLKIKGSEKLAALFGVTRGATISKLCVKGKVNGGDSVAGIVGYAEETTLSYCISNVKVSGVNQVGGVVGTCRNSTLSYCLNQGTVTGTGRCTGGIVADLYPSGKLYRCLNTTTVKGGGDLTGGITGGSTSGSISGCVCSGRVSSKGGRTGAIAGDNAGYAGERIKNFFRQTSTVNVGFGVVGSGSGTFKSKSSKKVTKIQNKIMKKFS